MIPALQAVVLVLATAGLGVAGVAAEGPLTKAIEIIGENLGEDSELPDNATKGQQTAYDHLIQNQERWWEMHGNMTAGGNETARPV